MTTITKLAKDLNLSIGTVSRILNDGNAPYAQETRRRVLSRAREIGYRANPVARALATGRTDAVALWIRDLTGFYDSWVIRSLSRHEDAAGFHLLVRLFEHSKETEAHAHPGVVSDAVDGVITHGLPPGEWLDRVQHESRRIPLVVTGGLPAVGVPDYVGINISTAAESAMEHLIGMGLRRIALLSTGNASDRRYRAYMIAMERSGLAPEVISMPRTGREESSRAQTRAFFREYVERCGYPDGVFCHNDDAAIAAYRALLDLGLRVPDDVALVGCDGIEDTEFLPVPITTIVQPFDEMAQYAWQFLKARIKDPDTEPQRITLEGRLEIRASSSK